jgi:tRNA modification GTPase
MSEVQDTIAAIATPLGRGAIGVIKISGEDALPILKKLFKPKSSRCSFESRKIYYGEIVDFRSGEVVDEVLCVYMKAPYTYTREDVVEIYAHGGPLLLRKILELVLLSGARPAKPGEFTLRAYLNGRIDLAQAEAICELISARSEEALKLAIRNLKGGLSKKIKPLREKLLELLVQLESSIEFPEEDIDTKGYEQLAQIIEKEILPVIEELISAYDQGRIYKEGISLVLAGKPNVGKSSLMNALLNEERAIVTPVPGTTRDFIEEEALIEGVPVKLIDTAGLRITEDPVERIGVERAKKKLKEADLILWMVDAGNSPDEEDKEIFKEISHYNFLAVINKLDLEPNFVREWEAFLKDLGIKEWLGISVKEGKNFELLRKKITEKVLAERGREVPEVAPNLRQKVSLEKAKEFLLSALKQLKTPSCLPEVVVLEIREAVKSLEEIIGEITSEDVLDQIFSTFCIGK